MNKSMIAGHIGKDAEVRHTGTGQKVTSFSVATNNRKGNGESETIWWRITLWGDRWDKMVPYLTKGKAVIVHGTIKKPNVYTDSQGNPQVSLELTADTVDFSPFGRQDQENQQGGYQQQAAPVAPVQSEEPSFGSAPEHASVETDEDIPF